MLLCNLPVKFNMLAWPAADGEHSEHQATTHGHTTWQGSNGGKLVVGWLVGWFKLATSRYSLLLGNIVVLGRDDINSDQPAQRQAARKSNA